MIPRRFMILHRQAVAQQAMMADKAHILILGQLPEGLLRLVRHPGEPRGFGGQQQHQRRVAQAFARPPGFGPGRSGVTRGQRDDAALRGDLAQTLPPPAAPGQHPARRAADAAQHTEQSGQQHSDQDQNQQRRRDRGFDPCRGRKRP